MSFGKPNIAGVVYDLTHLNSTLIRVKSTNPQAKVFRARVLFGCHAFTKELSPNDPPALHYPDGGTVRCFCPIRHGHSLNLPAIYRAAAAGGPTYFSGENMLLIDDSHGAAGPYITAYTIRKSTKPDVDAVINVRSAYMKPTLVRELSWLPFYSVVAAVAREQKIVRGDPRAW